MEITNGEALLPEMIMNKSFNTDIIVRLRCGEIIIIEAQSVNTTKSMIKNEFYADRKISNQIIKNNEYDKVNKVTQIVIIGENKVVKENHVLIESYTKKGDVDSRHKIMEGYRKTVWVDLEGEIDYSKYSNELIGLVLLLRATSKKEALKSVKWCSFLSKIVKEMEKFVEDNYVRTYMEKEQDYIEFIKEDTLKEGKEIWHIERNNELARMMYNDGEPMKKIKRYTGLTCKEIKKLVGYKQNNKLSLKK